ncbi:hypothetical protein LPU83_pLPU83d_1667 (plasmid) [Rhizobium favelukesii]|uniref:Uncharacterized protein n=1 Tax=Rhizobium favelukesii TaxID=348824 RepID=W6RPR8_9HYPH|nr:hypothetical protein LPU83_pLPU83d_1667 [Rhizobium favelukesii]
MNDLYADCALFRDMIARSDRSRLMVSFQHFPRGACDDASLLLARFLRERDHGTFQRMSGKRGDDTHVWLEQGDWVSDITGDQFGDFPYGHAHVGKDRSWHQPFSGEDTGPADYRHLDGPIVVDLNKTYSCLSDGH